MSDSRTNTARRRRFAAFNPRRCWIGALLCLAAGLGGCQLPKSKPAQASTVEKLSVTYELNGRFRDLPLDQGGDALDTIRVSHASACRTWKSASLHIEYPHPDGITSVGRATLRLSDTPPEQNRSQSVLDPRQTFRNPAGDYAYKVLRDDEEWVLDVPKHQLDLLLADLNQSGFFDHEREDSLGTHLAVEFNRNRTAKSWSAEPRLDEFVHRVHAEGHLSGFVAQRAIRRH